MFEDVEFMFSYTRAQALGDGVLVDVSKIAQEAGFGVPVAITDHLASRLTPHEYEKSQGQSYEGRLWDVLWLGMFNARKNPKASQVRYEVILAEQVEDRREMEQNTLRLNMVIGPGDQGEPIMTIGFPEDF
ncbi:MAG: DUF6573 family protein [Anaerolineales bacterium]